MTYKSRGRSLGEVILAVTIVGFVTGFVMVLCIGNYFRAKRAAERQRYVFLFLFVHHTISWMLFNHPTLPY